MTSEPSSSSAKVFPKLLNEVFAYSEDLFTRLIWLTLFMSCYITVVFHATKLKLGLETICVTKYPPDKDYYKNLLDSVKII